jgi:hypothetical protein
LDKVASDLADVMQGSEGMDEQRNDSDHEVATPVDLWDPQKGLATGGVNYGEIEVMVVMVLERAPASLRGELNR